MRLWQKWVVVNPVFHYHLWGQTRLMARRPLWQILLFCVPFAVIYLWLIDQAVRNGLPQLSLSLECLTLWLVAPLMSHALFAMEFEKATWDMLILTRLTAGQIVMGKFLSRLALLSFLAVLFVPLALIGALKEYQAVSSFSLLAWFAKTQLVVISWAILLIAVTLALSYWLKRGMVAAAVAFAGQVFVLFILPAFWMLFLALYAATTRQPLDPFDFRFGSEPTLRFGWMFDPRFAVVVYNPIAAIAGIGLYHLGAVPPDRQALLWGTWQGIVYLAVASLVVTALVRAVAKATRKPL